MRGANLTYHITPHNQDNGLFHTTEPAEERQLAPGRTRIKPVSRPFGNLFSDAVNHEVVGNQRRPQRDEAMMRSLRFPFDEDDYR